MSLPSPHGAVSLVRTLASIFYRKIELRFLAWVAKKRESDIAELRFQVGVAFKDATPLFSAIRSCVLDDMGHDCDANGNQVSGLCWNAPICITVYLEDAPSIGLGVELRGKTLSIRQMQGVRGRPLGRIVPDWPKFLVKACMAYATEVGLRGVRIYKADQDLGYRYPEFELKEGQSHVEALKAHRDRLRRRYDRTAQKFKFKKKKNYYLWEVPHQAQSP